MAGNKPKDTDSKIKFFKIEDGGEIAPAFPDGSPRSGSNAEEDSEVSVIRPEPPLMGSESTGTKDFSLSDPMLEPIEAQLTQQLDELKQEVEERSQVTQAPVSGQDGEALKNYLSIKETEVRDLKDQNKQYQAFLKKVSSQLEVNTRKNRDLLSELELLKRHEDALKNEIREIKDRHDSEISMLKSDYEDKLRRAGTLDSQIDDFSRKRDEWQDKIREDLKRIKLKERELENKYELLRRDTQALLDSKDKHTLELKKKNDALDLELEGMEERLRKANTVLNTIEGKKKRLIETMKLAIALLEQIDNAELSDRKDRERKAG